MEGQCSKNKAQILARTNGQTFWLSESLADLNRLPVKPLTLLHNKITTVIESSLPAVVLDFTIGVVKTFDMSKCFSITQTSHLYLLTYCHRFSVEYSFHVVFLDEILHLFP